MRHDQQLVDDMQAANVSPHVVIFNLVIDACARVNGHWEQAVKLIDDIQAANVSPSVVTFILIIDACANVNGHWEQTGKLIADIQAANVNPNVVIFTLVVTPAYRCSDLGASVVVQVLTLIDDMQARRSVPTS